MDKNEEIEKKKSRNLKTKKKLAVSLKKMMTQKPLNRITIQDIVDDCSLNRQSFYYHFADIYALLEWMYQEEALKIIERYKGKNFENWKQATISVLQFVQENPAECLCALRSVKQNQLRDFFTKDFELFYKTIFTNLCADLDVDEEFKEFIADLFVAGAEGYIVRWLENGMKNSPEQIADWLEIYLSGNVRDIFIRYDAYKRNRLSPQSV